MKIKVMIDGKTLEEYETIVKLEEEE